MWSCMGLPSPGRIWVVSKDGHWYCLWRRNFCPQYPLHLSWSLFLPTHHLRRVLICFWGEITARKTNCQFFKKGESFMFSCCVVKAAWCSTVQNNPLWVFLPLHTEFFPKSGLSEAVRAGLRLCYEGLWKWLLSAQWSCSHLGNIWSCFPDFLTSCEPLAPVASMGISGTQNWREAKGGKQPSWLSGHQFHCVRTKNRTGNIVFSFNMKN